MGQGEGPRVTRVTNKQSVDKFEMLLLGGGVSDWCLHSNSHPAPALPHCPPAIEGHAGPGTRVEITIITLALECIGARGV